MLNDKNRSIIESFSCYHSGLFTVDYWISIWTALATAVKQLTWIIHRDHKLPAQKNAWGAPLAAMHTTAGHPTQTELSTLVFFDPCHAAYLCPRNDVLYVEWDVKLYSLLTPRAARPSCGR